MLRGGVGVQRRVLLRMLGRRSWSLEAFIRGLGAPPIAIAVTGAAAHCDYIML